MQSQTTETVSDFANRLNSKDHTTRQQAQEDLRALIADDVHCLQRMHKALTGLALASVLIPVSGFIYTLATRVEYDGVIGYAAGMVIVMFGSATLLALHSRRAAHRIVALDLPQAVGPLVEVFATLGDFASGEIKSALIRLLPRLYSAMPIC